MNSDSDSNQNDLLESGKEMMRVGKLVESERMFKQILEKEPNEPDSLHLLGLVRFQAGHQEEAIKLIQQAITHGRPNENYLYNLAQFYKIMGRLSDAIENYHQALEIKPDYVDAHINMGTTLKDLGQVEDAVVCFLKAIDLKPDNAEVQNNLGNSLKQLGRLEEAITSYRKALSIKPEFAEVHNNLGNALKDLGKLEESVDNYQKAISINSDFVEAYNNLGNILIKLGQDDEGVSLLQKSLEIKPDYAMGHYNLGNAFHKLGKLDDAVESFQQALSIKPDYAGAQNNLGQVFQSLGRIDEAINCYRKTILIDPKNTAAKRNLLSSMIYVPGLTPEEQFADYSNFFDTQVRGTDLVIENLTNDTIPDRKLRIGYLSSDFHNHPVGFNVLPLISSHDHTKFEVFCYADVPISDSTTEQFKSCVNHWRSITGKSDSDIAEMVRTDGIDILVFLAAHFDNNRPLVCIHRVAPVQISYHDGMTSGLKEMDYWLTDDFLHPPDTKELFTEELIRLPTFYQYPSIEDAPLVGPLPADKTGFITFGSFNNPAKINEKVISLWAGVLKSVHGSQLLLKYKNWYDQKSLQANLVEKFATYGVEQDRIIFAAERDTMAEHLRRYGGVDIALDPFPCTGATTTFQALGMGVPVVSLVGETFVCRMSGSILHHVGLGSLLVDTPEAYITCARDLAGNLERLRTLRGRLREQVLTSPLCDPIAYARNVETAYLGMWKKWCAQ